MPSGSRARSPPPSPELEESTVARGTRYENLCLSLLPALFPHMQLSRTGGANDRGIDLRGWWTPPSSPYSNSLLPEKRVRILAQCKCQDEGGKKIGPVIIREMEGVVFRASSPSHLSESAGEEDGEDGDAPIAGIVLSSSGFSKQALLQVRSSGVPLVAMHVLAQPQSEALEPNNATAGGVGAGGVVERCVSIVWNDRFGSATNGLVDSGLELRWARPLTASSDGVEAPLGRPVIYRGDKPLR